MNERIKEIASQVLDELVPETWVALGYDKIKEIQFRTAELIVKECIAQAVKEEERYDSLDERDCDYCSMAMANFQGVLAKHFGVEE